jgi:hypothetical protein
MLLLLVAAVLGASVDAAACEPEMVRVSAVVGHSADSGQPTKSHGDAADACVHGHGHPGPQTITPGAPLPMRAELSEIYGSAAPPVLGFLKGETPEHPPRA